MFDLFVALLIVALISSFAGAVSAFTHYVLLSKWLTTAKAEVAKVEAKAASIKKAL